MRIVMMGTGPFAVPTFRKLLDSPHDVRALVTRPAPPPVPGRRATAPPNPMREVAEAAQLEIIAPVSINEPEAIDQLRAYEADLFVVCDYGQILSPTALGAAKLGGINLHASLLPKYRGAAPIHWAIYRGEAETGVTVIHMTPQLDAGPCVVQTSTPIGPEEDCGQLEARLAEMGVEAVMEAIEQLERWDGQTPLGQIQPKGQATKAPRLQKADGWVDWKQSATQIARQIRAFHPWPGTFTAWQRASQPMRLLILKAVAESDSTGSDHSASPQAGGSQEPGTVVRVDGEHAWIRCGEGLLRLDEVQPAGKTRQSVAQFLRGYPLAAGDQMTPKPSAG